MHIIHIGAECGPLIKVGGLGDALPALAKALAKKGNRVEIVLPKYQSLDLTKIKNLYNAGEFVCDIAQKSCSNKVWKGLFSENVAITLIDPEFDFFKRDEVYGYDDDQLRFAYFCKAALAYVSRTSCDLVHLHDWHTALIPLLNKIENRADLRFVLTIHNLSYQGICGREVLESLNIPSNEIDALIEGDGYSLLKAGILYSDKLTTVSPTYSKEILTHEFGGSLQPTLVACKDKLTGILNGIDTEIWDPETDPFLPFHFSWQDPSAKENVKTYLQRKFQLAPEKKPLVCSVTRLVHQKGPELIKAAIIETMKKGGQFFLLGSAWDPAIRKEFQDFQEKFRHRQSSVFELSYKKEETARSSLCGIRSISAVMPSLFGTLCGLAIDCDALSGQFPSSRSDSRGPAKILSP